MIKKSNIIDEKYGMLTIIERMLPKGGTVPVLCECICGNKKVISLGDLRRGKTTSCGCYRKQKTKNRLFKDISGNLYGMLTVLYLDPNHTSGKTKYICKCSCENKLISIGRDNLVRGITNSCGCIRKRRGKDHWAYKENAEKRKKRNNGSEYIEFRKLVMERDSYSCILCGKIGGYLEVHHLDGYHWCEEKRFDIENAVTLCNHANGCHKLFHSKYGRKNNTREQFDEFFENYQKLIWSSILF